MARHRGMAGVFENDTRIIKHMNKVLFVAVHPDDETIGCGGTILKHKAQGDEIYWMIITGNKNHPKGLFQDTLLEKAEAIENVSAAYSFNGVFQLGFPSSMLDDLTFLDIVTKISSVINEIKPNIVYTMFMNDVHTDHRVAFDAVSSCTKSFRYPFIEKLYMVETLSETEFAPSIPGQAFVPNVYVDITDYIDRKLEIMSMYKTEVMEEPYPRSLGSIKALARTRGSRAGVMYAEAFMLLYEKK